MFIAWTFTSSKIREIVSSNTVSSSRSLHVFNTQWAPVIASNKKIHYTFSCSRFLILARAHALSFSPTIRFLFFSSLPFLKENWKLAAEQRAEQHKQNNLWCVHILVAKINFNLDEAILCNQMYSTHSITVQHSDILGACTFWIIFKHVLYVVHLFPNTNTYAETRTYSTFIWIGRKTNQQWNLSVILNQTQWFALSRFLAHSHSLFGKMKNNVAFENLNIVIYDIKE